MSEHHSPDPGSAPPRAREVFSRRDATAAADTTSNAPVTEPSA